MVKSRGWGKKGAEKLNNPKEAPFDEQLKEGNNGNIIRVAVNSVSDNGYNMNYNTHNKVINRTVLASSANHNSVFKSWSNATEEEDDHGTIVSGLSMDSNMNHSNKREFKTIQQQRAFWSQLDILSTDAETENEGAARRNHHQPEQRPIAVPKRKLPVSPITPVAGDINNTAATATKSSTYDGRSESAVATVKPTEKEKVLNDWKDDEKVILDDYPITTGASSGNVEEEEGWAEYVSNMCQLPDNSAFLSICSYPSDFLKSIEKSLSLGQYCTDDVATAEDTYTTTKFSSVNTNDGSPITNGGTRNLSQNVHTAVNLGNDEMPEDELADDLQSKASSAHWSAADKNKYLYAMAKKAQKAAAAEIKSVSQIPDLASSSGSRMEDEDREMPLERPNFGQSISASASDLSTRSGISKTISLSNSAVFKESASIHAPVIIKNDPSKQKLSTVVSTDECSSDVPASETESRLEQAPTPSLNSNRGVQVKPLAVSELRPWRGSSKQANSTDTQSQRNVLQSNDNSPSKSYDKPHPNIDVNRNEKVNKRSQPISMSPVVTENKVADNDMENNFVSRQNIAGDKSKSIKNLDNVSSKAYQGSPPSMDGKLRIPVRKKKKKKNWEEVVTDAEMSSDNESQYTLQTVSTDVYNQYRKNESVPLRKITRVEEADNYLNDMEDDGSLHTYETANTTNSQFSLAGERRLQKAKEAKRREQQMGWSESMKAVASKGVVPDKEWDPDLGWVEASEETKMQRLNASRIQNTIEEPEIPVYREPIAPPEFYGKPLQHTPIQSSVLRKKSQVKNLDRRVTFAPSTKLKVTQVVKQKVTESDNLLFSEDDNSSSEDDQFSNNPRRIVSNELDEDPTMSNEHLPTSIAAMSRGRELLAHRKEDENMYNYTKDEVEEHNEILSDNGSETRFSEDGEPHDEHEIHGNNLPERKDSNFDESSYDEEVSVEEEEAVEEEEPEAEEEGDFDDVHDNEDDGKQEAMSRTRELIARLEQKQLQNHDVRAPVPISLSKSRSTDSYDQMKLKHVQKENVKVPPPISSSKSRSVDSHDKNFDTVSTSTRGETAKIQKKNNELISREKSNKATIDILNNLPRNVRIERKVDKISEKNIPEESSRNKIPPKFKGTGVASRYLESIEDKKAPSKIMRKNTTEESVFDSSTVTTNFTKASEDSSIRGIKYSKAYSIDTVSGIDSSVRPAIMEPIDQSFPSATKDQNYSDHSAHSVPVKLARSEDDMSYSEYTGSSKPIKNLNCYPNNNYSKSDFDMREHLEFMSRASPVNPVKRTFSTNQPQMFKNLMATLTCANPAAADESSFMESDASDDETDRRYPEESYVQPIKSKNFNLAREMDEADNSSSTGIDELEHSSEEENGNGQVVVRPPTDAGAAKSYNGFFKSTKTSSQNKLHHDKVKNVSNEDEHDVPISNESAINRVRRSGSYSPSWQTAGSFVHNKYQERNFQSNNPNGNHLKASNDRSAKNEERRSNSNSPSWQTLLAKRAAAKRQCSDGNKAAEDHAAAKVEEMMSAIPSSNEGIQRADKQVAQRKRLEDMISKKSLPTSAGATSSSNNLKDAEAEAAKKVEEMMASMTFN